MIYVCLPNSSLQGAEIPFYMLWDRSESFDLIKIEYPGEIEVEEIYNVSEGNFTYVEPFWVHRLPFILILPFCRDWERGGGRG